MKEHFQQVFNCLKICVLGKSSGTFLRIFKDSISGTIISTPCEVRQEVAAPLLDSFCLQSHVCPFSNQTSELCFHSCLQTHLVRLVSTSLSPAARRWCGARQQGLTLSSQPRVHFVFFSKSRVSTRTAQLEKVPSPEGGMMLLSAELPVPLSI